MLSCKNCGSQNCVKNGKVRGKQRYRCNDCGYNFVEGDARTDEKIIAAKAMCVILYSLAKGSYNMLGKIFGRDRSLIYRWIKEAGLRLSEPEIDGEVREIEFDEMWHFIEQKKTSFGSSRPLVAAHGRLSPGCSALVILQRSEGSTTRSSTSHGASFTPTAGRRSPKSCRRKGTSPARNTPSPLNATTATPAITSDGSHGEQRSCQRNKKWST